MRLIEAADFFKIVLPLTDIIDITAIIAVTGIKNLSIRSNKKNGIQVSSYHEKLFLKLDD